MTVDRGLWRKRRRNSLMGVEGTDRSYENSIWSEYVIYLYENVRIKFIGIHDYCKLKHKYNHQSKYIKENQWRFSGTKEQRKHFSSQTTQARGIRTKPSSTREKYPSRQRLSAERTQRSNIWEGGAQKTCS